MGCCCCDPPDYDAMFGAYERLKKSGSLFDQYVARQFEKWVLDQLKPSIFDKPMNPLHGKVIRWTGSK